MPLEVVVERAGQASDKEIKYEVAPEMSLRIGVTKAASRMDGEVTITQFSKDRVVKGNFMIVRNQLASLSHAAFNLETLFLLANMGTRNIATLIVGVPSLFEISPKT